MEGNGLIRAFILDGKGGGKEIGWKEIKAWDPSQGLLWLHLDYMGTAAQKWLRTQSGLQHTIAEAMLTEETRPRCIPNTDSIFICLRGVNLNPGQEPEDMVSVRINLEKNRIITTRNRKVLSVEDISIALINGTGPKSSGEFITILNENLTNRISHFVDTEDETIDKLEEDIITADRITLRTQISELRREVIASRRFLSPQREALYQLQIANSNLLEPDNKTHLRENVDRVIKYIEDLDSIRDRAAVLQEELSNRIAEQTDRRMYLLSLVAVIFLPLTFITGLLGINVSGIPGSGYRWGFLLVCFFLGICALITFILLKRKKWI